MEKAVIITLILMIALVIISVVIGLAWVYSPTEFVLRFEIDDRSLDVISNFTEVYENSSGFEEVIDGALEKYSGGLD